MAPHAGSRQILWVNDKACVFKVDVLCHIPLLLFRFVAMAELTMASNVIVAAVTIHAATVPLAN